MFFEPIPVMLWAKEGLDGTVSYQCRSQFLSGFYLVFIFYAVYRVDGIVESLCQTHLFGYFPHNLGDVSSTVLRFNHGLHCVEIPVFHAVGVIKIQAYTLNKV
ncbi:hypothetical protein ES703_82421 [subsurface metagenome]